MVNNKPQQEIADAAERDRAARYRYQRDLLQKLLPVVGPAVDRAKALERLERNLDRSGPELSL